MPLQETSGNATADAYGGGAAAAVKYIENYFQTWLRTGTGASATVTTGLDASTNKALVWTKSRSDATDHKLTDTVRGATNALISDTTGAQTTDTNGLTAFSSTGYTIGTDTNYNNSGATYVDWEFVATPKFFDVVTYTGNGTTQNIAHNLGSVPGCIIVKRTSATSHWFVYHNGLTTPQSAYIYLETTGAQTTGDTTIWNNTAPTSTQFSVGSASLTNGSGSTYVAYLFAHNAGGFGLTGTDNVISCGSYTGTGSLGNPITLGFEPQWILVKNTTSAANWVVVDIMRGASDSATSCALLYPNGSNAEVTGQQGIAVTATGFKFYGGGPLINASGSTYIYIAIRRGPMKVPTDATKVFVPISTPPSSTVTAGFVPDFSITKQTDNGAGSSSATYAGSRLQGNGAYLSMSDTSAEGAFGWSWDSASTKFSQSSVGTPVYSELFGRAPSFFDMVFYTGNGTSGRNVPHNLGVAPELVIIKIRSSTGDWVVTTNFTATTASELYLDTNQSQTGGTPQTYSNLTLGGKPTSTNLVFGYPYGLINTNGATYSAYLFSTCAGVSKVGGYTGTGATQTISCGFTGGARFVMIKRTDSTGNWWYWDTTRGMVAGNDQRMAINDTTTQAGGNWVYTTTGGFQIVTTNADVNASGGSYLFFAVA